MKESTFKKYCLVVDEWFVNGFNGTKAYQKFYPKASNNASDVGWREIYGNLRIEEYIKKKRSNTSNKLQITLERQLLELERLKGLSEEGEKFNDAINALKEQNKLLALYKDHNEQKNPKAEYDWSSLNDEDLMKMAEIRMKATK